MDIQDFEPFLNTFFEKIEELGIDVSNYELDHIAYQTSSSDDYEQLLPEFKKIGDMVQEAMVNGRRVGIFKLHEPFVYSQHSIPVIELIEPKEGQVCTSGPEHAEFVIDSDFHSFMDKYPDVNWDDSQIDHPEFPMVKLKLEDGMQVKFHLKSVLEIIKHE